jgi:hypothetical protein
MHVATGSMSSSGGRPSVAAHAERFLLMLGSHVVLSYASGATTASILASARRVEMMIRSQPQVREWAGKGSNLRPRDYESGNNRRPSPCSDIAPGHTVHLIRAVHTVSSVLHSLMGNVMGNPASRFDQR